MSNSPVPFAVVGAGWRSAFFLRVAAAMPDRLRVTGMLTRTGGPGTVPIGDVPVHATLDGLLAGQPKFVVVSVPWPATPVLVRELAGRGVPVLAETPPAPDLAGLDGLLHLARNPPVPIEVAEQYHLQPLHAARLAVVASGLLGTVSQAQVSAAHGYHGINLLRRYLGAEPGEVRIRARTFASPIVAGPDRAGPPVSEQLATSDQTLAWLDFDGRLGVFDFADDQYFSWIRASRVLVRGERGEISDETVRHLLDARTPVTERLDRRDAGQGGNLEGLHHIGYTLGHRWVYRNPTAPARLADDEIAVAGCLLAMAEHVDGGPSRCSLAEAAWDHELGLRVAEAAASGSEALADGRRWRRR